MHQFKKTSSKTYGTDEVTILTLQFIGWESTQTRNATEDPTSSHPPSDIFR